MNILLTAFLIIHSGYVLFILSQLMLLPAPDEDEEKTSHTSFEPEELTKVSVVVPARNEAKHLPDLLKSLASQSYPKEKFEIIIIDDGSTDESATILKQFKKDHPDLDIKVFISEPKFDGAYKKQALAQGIQKAKGLIIFQTDADVIIPPKWIETMTAYFDKDTVFLAGGVRYLTDSFFTELQALELAGLVGLSASGFAMKRPFLCNGANIAFRKSAYLAVGGYEGIDHIASGDDMLLLQKMEQKFPRQSKFVFSREVIIDTYPCENLSQWWSQRRRWVSKSLAYLNFKVIVGNLVVYFYHVGLAAMPILFLFGWNDHHIDWMLMCLGVLGTKWIVDGVFLYASTRFLERIKWLRGLLVGEIIYPYYVTLIGLSGVLFKKYRWKGRIQQ